MFFQKERVMEGGGNSDPAIVNVVENENVQKKKSDRMLVGICIFGVSSLTAVVAGAIASQMAKKKANEYFKDLDKGAKVVLESPTSLAFRALGWATVWSVGLFSLSVFGLWKWYGIKDLDDLRTRLARYKKNSTQSEGRTEFESLSDFLSYLEETSKQSKQKSSTGDLSS